MPDSSAQASTSAPKDARRSFSLPAWLDHFNARDLKVLFRCWAATWVASLLIFIGPSLHAIGISAYFAGITLYIVPPGTIFFIYLLASVSLLFGMCLAWGWGLITMKAALAARPASETQALLQALRQQVMTEAQQTGQSTAYLSKKLVYDGFMLDARVTVVYYVMICVFIYALSRLRAANPKFALAQVFGVIVSDLFLMYGPILTSFNGLLARVLVLPGSIGIGLGVACNIIFFPQSASHAVLVKMETLVRIGQKSLQCTRARLSSEPVDLADLEGTKSKMIALFKAMTPMLGFLPLDVSWGRWSPDDVKMLHESLRRAMFTNVSLLDFHIVHMRTYQKLENLSSLETDYSISTEEKPPAGQSLTLVAECIHTVNSRYWFRRVPQSQIDKLVTRGQTLRETLRTARGRFMTETTERLLDNHSDLFDEEGTLKSAESVGPYALRGLMLGMVVEERVLGAAESLENLLDHIVRLLQTRTKVRVCPGGRFICHRGGTDPDVIESQSKEAYRRLRISQGYGRPVRRNALSRGIVAVFRWLTNPGGMYALRMVIVTIATAIPSALPHSAGFYYREKGIWLAITAQTTILVYMADFTLSLIGRCIGTVLGGVLGMVAWYIGSGHGPGNAYGLAAITAAMTVVLMWWRLYLPPAFMMAAIMSGVTFMLVIGFSYDDTHTPQYGLPGHGYTAFYKRLVTVLLGFVAAFVVQIFPRPPSATRHTCKTLSNTVNTLSDHYALLPLTGAAPTPTAAVLSGSIRILKLEMSIGPFDSQTVDQTRRLCQEMNQGLGRLLDLSSTLPIDFQTRLARNVGILDHRRIGDIMAVLSVIAQALRLGNPLPERLPTPLVKRCHESWQAGQNEQRLTIALVRDENYRRYCVAVSSYLKFLGAIDDLVLVLKRALGESHIVGQWDDASV
ncbi:uncharacterized protein ATNIH1004_002026 [Aspergillus tanneri]|uniref:ER transporter 6TM N-terminal domain-containing protein n=1 Tax=Aspergillus tanneri TaxID=1220188 RepID=A0A5M9M6T3_9EURO|nr:uncharacterized protein ATNIH1004_002026 [Aspergillus tanneri]KAA8641286.1 hypothetical protein ATNIH1004_002026 [Aspergillus tanneri]